jgi:hypothetical protein
VGDQLCAADIAGVGDGGWVEDQIVIQARMALGNPLTYFE